MELHRTLVVVRKSPLGSVDSFEAMRLALSFYAADVPVTVLFEGPGALNWVSRVTGSDALAQSISRIVADFERFKIPTYVISEDLAENGFAPAELASRHPTVIPRSQAHSMLMAYDTVVAV